MVRLLRAVAGPQHYVERSSISKAVVDFSLGIRLEPLVGQMIVLAFGPLLGGLAVKPLHPGRSVIGTVDAGRDVARHPHVIDLADARPIVAVIHEVL